MNKYKKEIFKKRLEKKIKKFLFFYFFPFFLVFDIFLFIFNSHFLAIKKIDIVAKGFDLKQKKEIRKEIGNILNERYYHLFNKDNYIFYPKDFIIKKLKKEYKEIKNIDIKNEKWFSKIQINIEERKVENFYCQSEKKINCYAVDKDGYIFKNIKLAKNAKNIFLSKDILNIGSKFFNSDEENKKIKKLILFLKEKKIENNFLIKPNKYFYIFKLKNNTKIIFNSDISEDDFKLKINKFLEKKNFKNIAYLDISLRDRIDYCEKGEVCEGNF